MNRPLIWLLVSLAIVTFPSVVYAFDCAKASLPVDFVICSDPDVFKANDVHEKASYETRSRLNEEQKKALLADQRRWLKEYPPNCGVPSRGKPLPVVGKEAQQCVARSLLARAEFLRQYPGSPAGVQASKQSPSIAPASGDSGRQPIAANIEPQVPSPSAKSSNTDTTAGLKDAYEDPFAYCRAVGTIDRPDRRLQGPKSRSAQQQRSGYSQRISGVRPSNGGALKARYSRVQAKGFAEKCPMSAKIPLRQII